MPTQCRPLFSGTQEADQFFGAAWLRKICFAGLLTPFSLAVLIRGLIAPASEALLELLGGFIRLPLHLIKRATTPCTLSSILVQYNTSTRNADKHHRQLGLHKGRLHSKTGSLLGRQRWVRRRLAKVIYLDGRSNSCASSKTL